MGIKFESGTIGKTESIIGSGLSNAYISQDLLKIYQMCSKLQILVLKKPNNLQLLGGCAPDPCFRDPLLSLAPSLRESYVGLPLQHYQVSMLTVWKQGVLVSGVSLSMKVTNIGTASGLKCWLYLLMQGFYYARYKMLLLD